MFPYTAKEYNRPNFKPIPDGLYKAEINKAKKVENKAQTGKGINVCYNILEGMHANRILFDTFYLQHQNKEYEEKEHNRFNGVLEVIKLKVINHESELYHKILTIKVKTKKASSDGQFPESNIIVDYFPYDYSEGDDNRSDDKNHDNIPF